VREALTALGYFGVAPALYCDYSKIQVRRVLLHFWIFGLRGPSPLLDILASLNTAQVPLQNILKR
jgi:hypothetical protein